MDRLRVHAEQYASKSKASYMAMQEVFDDLEVEDQEQRVELESVMSKSLGVWSAAVSELKGRQTAVRDHIQTLLSTIMTIKTELGADNPAADADLQRLQVGVLCSVTGWQAQGSCMRGVCTEQQPTQPVCAPLCCGCRATAPHTARCARGRWTCSARPPTGTRQSSSA